MEMRLEVVQVPVSDVDRAKSFYTEKLGFVLDQDVEHVPGMRVVQLTPPGSAASIVIGTGMTAMQPGSLEGLQLVVPDMGACCLPTSPIRMATAGSSRAPHRRRSGMRTSNG
jgi:catechol 2,3-dioxygenase-like lactoylglutathione lyase family enzyme